MRLHVGERTMLCESVLSRFRCHNLETSVSNNPIYSIRTCRSTTCDSSVVNLRLSPGAREEAKQRLFCDCLTPKSCFVFFFHCTTQRCHFGSWPQKELTNKASKSSCADSPRSKTMPRPQHPCCQTSQRPSSFSFLKTVGEH